MIIDHPKIKHSVNAPWASEASKVVKCDKCGKLAEKCGVDAGEAADAARKCGFKPVSRGFQNPMDWCCPECSK